ncbi:MAG: glycogen synthase, partial [Bacteroidota bacterium]
YAGSDFLLMPSRVEPCGLNQMYAMRYGTIPIVRKVGGLVDTVIDIGAPGGHGLTFNHLSADDALIALHRAMEAYQDQTYFAELRERVMGVNFSWQKSAEQYLDLYRRVGMS